MTLTDDEILKCQCGVPILFEDICAVYSVTLREIVEIGYSKFQQYLGIMLSQKPAITGKEEPELRELLSQLTDFQYLLMMSNIDAQTNALLKEAFFFFTHEQVIFSIDPAQIIIGPLSENHIIIEDQFYELQRLLRRMYFIDQESEDIMIHSDDSLVVRKLKEQMRANREKLRRAKAKEARRSKNTNEIEFSDLVASVALNHCNLNMVNIWNLTYYSFNDQLKRMGFRDKFLTNEKAALAGAKIKKSELKHWIRSIHDKT